MYSRDCAPILPFVERGEIDTDTVRLVAQDLLYDLKDCGLDCLILGSPFLAALFPVIAETMANTVELIDATVWTAREAAGVIDALGARSAGGQGTYRFLFSDVSPEHAKQVGRLFGEPVQLDLFEIKPVSVDRMSS